MISREDYIKQLPNSIKAEIKRIFEMPLCTVNYQKGECEGYQGCINPFNRKGEWSKDPTIKAVGFIPENPPKYRVYMDLVDLANGKGDIMIGIGEQHLLEITNV